MLLMQNKGPKVQKEQNACYNKSMISNLAFR